MKKFTKADIISVTDYNEKYKPKAKRKKVEENVHVQVCSYLDLKYPDVVYTSDQSGLRMPLGLAVKTAKTRSKRYKIPDIIILKPSNGFCGLIIEVKKNHDEAYTKKGELRESEHIQKQWASLQRLVKDGYMAVFGCGYNECVKIIESYFKLNHHD